MDVRGAGALVAVLAAAFLVQRAFSLVQAKSVRVAYADMYRRRHETCCIAYGKSKDLLMFKGCMVILAVNTSGIVEEALRLEGRTIFSRIQKAPEMVGINATQMALADRGGTVRHSDTCRISREQRLVERALCEASRNAVEHMSKLAVELR